MGETPQHRLLKELGVLWLRGRGCSIIATECYIHPDSSRWQTNENKTIPDRHYIADVLGAARCYSRMNYHTLKSEKPAHDYEVLCVEVKVSRADFKNGFIQSSCNKHYVLTPPNLLTKEDLPKHVGLLERNPAAATVWEWSSGFSVPSIRTVKPARRQEIDEEQIQHCIRSIGGRATTSLLSVLMDKYKPEGMIDINSVIEES